ncbi:MAG: hypothetical protein OXN44_02250 [Acidimicrobiaceae bacterium]|nr:hypothetical protein [Acidimicrobiaceae bacterium]
MFTFDRANAVKLTYSGEHAQAIRAMQRMARGGMKVEGTHLEVSYKATLAAVDNDVERRLTSEEFSTAFERMADKLYGIDGLVDPSLWGQASNGEIEIDFYIENSGDTEQMTDRVMSVIAKVAAAGGVDMDRFGDLTEHCQRATADDTPLIANHSEGYPCIVLSQARHTAEVVLASPARVCP